MSDEPPDNTEDRTFMYGLTITFDQQPTEASYNTLLDALIGVTTDTTERLKQKRAEPSDAPFTMQASGWWTGTIKVGNEIITYRWSSEIP